MSLCFRHAIQCMTLGSGAIALQAGAAADPLKSSSMTNVINESGRAVDLIVPEAGILISVVLIALVLIARRIKHHD